MTTPTLRELLRGGTARPWKYGALEFGGRGIVDGHGYHFAQVDDDGNGYLICAAVNEAEGLLNRLDEAAALINRQEMTLSDMSRERERLRALVAEACDYIEADTDPDEEHPFATRIRRAAGLEKEGE
jgi:hypothetical protein